MAKNEHDYARMGVVAQQNVRQSKSAAAIDLLVETQGLNSIFKLSLNSSFLFPTIQICGWTQFVILLQHE